MYLTQANVIRGLSKEEYSILRDMCQYSNNLYNVALYNIRQYYFQEKKFLRYEENYHICKENENYGLLQAGVVGYSQWQLTDDSGPAALIGVHSAHHAAGAQVSYIFWPQKAMLRAAFFREFNVRAGSGLATRGNLLRLTWIKAF